MAAHGRAGRGANPRYHPPMKCACESEYAFPCQFTGVSPLFPFAGKEWCRFHLPLQDAAGNKSDKGRGKNGWEEVGPELEKFTGEIHARLHAAKPWDGPFSGDDDTRANLKGVAFPPGFDFSALYAELHVAELHADFSHASFGDRAKFTGATFGGEADFIGAKFGDEAYFYGATFGGGANFSNAAFGNKADFNSAIFGERANFIGATFDDTSYFYGAKFGNEAKFTGAIFGGGAVFHDAVLGNYSSFSWAKFSGSVIFSTSLGKKFRLEDMDFSDASFRGPCIFDNRSFGTRVNFNGGGFEDLAQFHGCTFHPGMSFHQTKFLKTKGVDDDATERLERSYRTLKRAMADLHARNEEADFFALEMECRRQRGSVPWFERVAATAYKHLSDYGRSVDLPLIWLLVLAYAAHYLLYLPIALITCNPGPGARLAFTLEQMFRPFYVWAKSPPGTGNCLVDSNPVIIPILASLQSLAVIALLTLFLLALRRRFKMD